MLAPSFDDATGVFAIEVPKTNLLSQVFLSRQSSRQGHAPLGIYAELEVMRFVVFFFFFFKKKELFLFSAFHRRTVFLRRFGTSPVRAGRGRRRDVAARREARQAGGGRQGRPLPAAAEHTAATQRSSRLAAHRRTRKLLLERHAAIMRHRPPAAWLM